MIQGCKMKELEKELARYRAQAAGVEGEKSGESEKIEKVQEGEKGVEEKMDGVE
jgi:hypothetical protein